MRKRRRTYAEARYRQGLMSWRRAIRRRVLVVLAPLFIAAVAWGLAQHDDSAFMPGFVAGSIAAVFLAVREYAPDYVENWGQGAEGERKTRHVLEALGWRFVEDVDTGRGNYDHVAVGVPGVFMIESKNLTGITEVRDGVARLRRRHDPDADRPLLRLQPSVLGASAEVSQTIWRQTGRRQWVHAIVVFWNEFPQGIVETDRITFVQGRQLGDYLQAMPAKAR